MERQKMIFKEFHPPPWELTEENEQKTEGWCAFQESSHYRYRLEQERKRFRIIQKKEFASEERSS
jgi:hypothetical protein